ncbi:hypothetical protein HK099_005801 [Clydaea vesicula]|uniref:Uncharacterized protein n=1 Tax=Clydaea vesicula TaxID=447962 RepID=A0AAD5XYK7_9FUNG|nr:hypothetical protein HK099_005801 [Clydaea vesicula]
MINPIAEVSTTSSNENLTLNEVEDPAKCEVPKHSKFKKAAHKVMRIKRVTKLDRNLLLGNSSGVDLKLPPSYISEIFTLTNISVIDYDQESYKYTALENETLAKFLQKERPAFSKVRWINVQGISFDVIKILGEFYNLHPLALEDIFHIPQRIKCDYYDGQLFVSMILLNLSENFVSENVNAESERGILTPFRRKQSFELPINSSSIDVPGERGLCSTLFGGAQGYLKQLGLSSKQLELFRRPECQVEQCSFFVLNNGVIISIFQNESEQITESLKKRLKPLANINSHPPTSNNAKKVEYPKSLLRKSSDVSILLHSLIDGCVDYNSLLLDFYAKQIDSLQDMVISNPKEIYTKILHLIGKELKMIHRALKPQQSLVAAISERNIDESKNADESLVTISKLAKVYFNDVSDQCIMVNEELQAFETNTKDLIDLTFNSISHSTNESMRTLAVVSVIFLPITFLAGVYGMNFRNFPEIETENGYYYFWVYTALSMD